MINPNDFLNKKEVKDKDTLSDAIDISGSFVCQECSELCKKAKLDESSKQIIWFCSQEHKSVAKI